MESHHDNDVSPALANHARRPTQVGSTSPSSAIRNIPVGHDHAQHRSLYRVGAHHRTIHQDRMDGQARCRRRVGPTARWVEQQRCGEYRSRRPDDHLPAPASHREYRWPDDLWHAWWSDRRHRHDGRHRRHQHSDVHRCDDRGPARGLHHQAGGQDLGRKDPPRFRDAGRQLLRWNRRDARRNRRILRHRARRHCIEQRNRSSRRRFGQCGPASPR